MLLKLSFIAKQIMYRRKIVLDKPMQKAFDIFIREMKNFLSNIEIKETKVGQSFNYPHNIIKKDIYRKCGNFTKYFIRKHLSNQYRTDLKDIAVEMALKRPRHYFKDQDLKPHISEHYDIFKDPEKMAMDILKSIKIVSQAYSATYTKNYKIRRIINIDNEDEMLLEIIKYFKSLPFKKVELTPMLDCEDLGAVPEIIFDNGKEKVLYDIQISKYVTLVEYDDKFSPANFYKLIAYAYCYYTKTGRIIKTFRIYNPLLGYEHQIVINNIDFDEFESCLIEDIYFPSFTEK